MTKSELANTDPEHPESSTRVSVRPAIILYADMLGFSDKVNAANPAHDAEALVSRLDHFAIQFSGADYEDKEIREFFAKKYWAFSDSLVVCLYGGSDAQKVMTEFDADLDQISSIALAQGHIMWTDGQLVRGGVARGWFAEKGNTVVGSALVKAARIEKEIAAPFIGVELELYEYYVSHQGRRYYAADIDPAPGLFIAPCPYTSNRPALDYFAITLDSVDLTGAQIRATQALPHDERRDEYRNKCWTANRRAYVTWHRDFVTQGLKDPDHRIQKKYEALKAHHNTHVDQLYPGDSTMLVS
jgi:hypothetical protein